MAKRKVVTTIIRERCKGCELCVSVCPSGALRISDEINDRGARYAVLENPGKCTGCGLCVTVCPDNCIEIKIEEDGR